MPAGAEKTEIDFGQTSAGPVNEHTGNGATVSTTSLVSVQPLAWKTVSRRVAETEETYAVVISELGKSIVAIPFTTLQLVETIGCNPAVADPFREKVVDGPSMHRV